MRAAKILAFVLSLVLVLCTCISVFSESATAEVTSSPSSVTPQPAPTFSDRYWKKDTRDSGSGHLPSNYRTMFDAFPSAEEGTDLTALRTGMETTFISGSGQYSASSFAAMIDDIRSRTDAVICVFDLRQETHGFANGTAVSLYASHNAGNVGLNVEEVLELEKVQLGQLKGTMLTLDGDKSHSGKSRSGSSPKPSSTPEVLTVTEIMTEAELCASLNVQYVRLSCTDHLCPEDEDVDDFMTAYLALPEGAWLHFHCAAGVGRTGLFMMMADMLRNPDVALDTIITRQAKFGASDPRDPQSSEDEESDTKLSLLQRFYDYVQECRADGFKLSFTEWNTAKNR